MALQVTQNKGTVYLEGRINSTTARLFIIHAEHFLDKLKNIKINIDKVKEIDRDGIEAIKTVWSIALKRNRKFAVTGLGCKEIYDHFENQFIA